MPSPSDPRAPATSMETRVDESMPQTPASTSAASSSPGGERPAEETIKETLESIVIAFILAFVFRAYVVEAFVIPTGSMAPTLLGAHISVTCAQCGYSYDVGMDRGDDERAVSYLPTRLSSICPMCAYHNLSPANTRVGSGDRILVHKYIYSFSEPRRWDVVVFKAPHDPKTNFIKRLIGLENEAVYLFDGNVYTRPVTTDDEGTPILAPGATWQIARKTDRPDVQRAVWQPLYHSDYIPLDGGERPAPSPDWSVPWKPVDEDAGWQIDGRRSYLYDGRGDGRIRFDLSRNPAFPHALYPYNQTQEEMNPEPIEDVRIAATVQPQRVGVGVALSTTARLDDREIGYGLERLRATLAADGTLTLEAVNLDTGAARTLGRSTEVGPLEPGENTRLELWYVDQEASVWVNDDLVLRWRYDVDLETVLLQRDPPAQMPDIQIAVTGGGAVLHSVEVDRDLYYTTYSLRGIHRAALHRRGDWEPLILGEDDFFCVGDNGPRSFDSRYWDRVNPWVEARMLEDRVEAGLDPRGIVPRDLMMGRAFFVYFPSPYMLGIVPLPNFGDMRFIN